MKFPRVAGTTLEGENVSLPRYFSGEPTLILLSFQWQQRSLVDPWCSIAEEFADRYDSFEYYELLIVDWRSRMLISETRKADLLSGDRHDGMLVLRVNKRQFRQSLGLLGEDTVYALLVDDGFVVRQAAGFPNRDTAAAIDSLLQRWEDARPDGAEGELPAD